MRIGPIVVAVGRPGINLRECQPVASARPEERIRRSPREPLATSRLGTDSASAATHQKVIVPLFRYASAAQGYSLIHNRKLSLCRCWVRILGIAVNDGKPCGLDLDHDAVSLEEDVIVIAQRNIPLDILP